MVVQRDILADLRNKIRCVRESILSLVARMEDIVLQRIPQIRADYALKIGCWDQALLEAKLAAQRARRRLQLAQAQVNRGEMPHMDDIEEQLDIELSAWVTKAEQARLAYEQALAYLANTTPMSMQDAGELKRGYRILVKRLHPDVRAGEGEGRAALFLLAQAAYRNGDVAALHSLEVATRHLEPSEDDLEATDDVGLLGQELELARIEADVMRERLCVLEDGEEMRLARLLADPDWVTKRTAELRRAVEEWERVRRECDRRLQEIKEGFYEH